MNDRFSALIWDLDGTLIDSYRMIVPALRQFYREQGVERSEAEIRRAVLGSSVRDFAADMLAETGVSLDAGMARYLEIRSGLEQLLQPMPGARQVLDALAARGVPSFLLTHRGDSTAAVLRRTGLDGAFVGIVTGRSGFPRKPAPDGLLYLVERYGLDPARSFYVGDRQMDLDCAHNAGLRAIALETPDGPALRCAAGDLRIRSLPELLN